MIHLLNSEVMHEVRQTFCLDLFSMFDKTGSRELFNFVVLSRYVNSYMNRKRSGVHIIRMLISKVKFQEKNAHLYTRVDRHDTLEQFSSLKWGGGGGGGGSGV